LRVLHGPAAPAVFLRAAPDGRRVAAVHLLGNGGPLHTLSVWDLHAGTAEPSATVEGNFSGFAFAGPGEWIAAADGTAIQFFRSVDLGRMQRLIGFEGAVLPKPGSNAVIAAAVDGRLLNVAPDGTPDLGFASLNAVSRLKPHLGTMDLASDGNRLALVYANQNNPRAGLVIGLFDLETKKLVDRFSTRRRQIQALRFAPDGRRLAVLTATQVLIWDVVTKKRLALLEAKSGKETRFALCVEFSRDGRTLFLGTDDGLHLYETATWSPLRRYDFARGAIFSVAMTPDGLCGLAGGADGRIAVWDLDE